MLYLVVGLPDLDPAALAKKLAEAQDALPEVLALVEPLVPQLADNLLGELAPRMAGLLGGDAAGAFGRLREWLADLEVGIATGANIPPELMGEFCLYRQRLAAQGRVLLAEPQG